MYEYKKIYKKERIIKLLLSELLSSITSLYMYYHNEADKADKSSDMCYHYIYTCNIHNINFSIDSLHSWPKGDKHLFFLN